jgi:hypothetical protein
MARSPGRGDQRDWRPTAMNTEQKRPSVIWRQKFLAPINARGDDVCEELVSIWRSLGLSCSGRRTRGSGCLKDVRK